MNKEELEKKLQEEVDLFNQVNRNIDQLTQTREQIRGKVLVLQELIQEQPTAVSPAQLELVADEEDTEVE